MNREGIKQQASERAPQQRVLSVPEVMNQYNSLSKEKQAANYGKLFSALDAAVTKAATDYASRKGIEEQTDFVATLRHIANLNAPAAVMSEMTKTYAERTFGGPDIKPELRNAYATVLFHMGGDSQFGERAQQIANAHSAAYKERERGKSPSADMRVRIAEKLLEKMNIVIEQEEIPSYHEVVTTKLRDNSRKIAVAGTGAVVAGSIVFGGAGAALASTPAAAPVIGGGGASTAAVQMSGPTSEKAAAASPTPSVAVSVNLDAQSAAVQFAGTEAQRAPSVENAVAAPRATAAREAVTMTSSSVTAKPNVDTEAVVATTVQAAQSTNVEAVVFAAPADPTKEASVAPAVIAPEIMPIAPAKNGSVSGNTENAQPSSSPDVAAGYDTTNSDIEVSIPTPTAVSMNTTPTAAPVETADTTNTDGTTKEMSKAQKTLAAIQNSISTGNVDTAVARIIAAYQDKSPSSAQFDAEGNPVIPITNQTLLDNLTKDPDSSVEAATLAAIHDGAHSDATYTQNIITALSVLEAASHDQTILDSPDVQTLLANIKRPDGEYPGKLYDQYQQKGVTFLTQKDDNGKSAVDGFTDAHAKTVETLYGYVLQGQISDTDQKSQEDTMQKADEAAAAAAKAAAEKAAAEAAAAASENNQSAQAEALQNLINESGDQFNKGNYEAMQFFMSKGLKDYQAAGIIGNLDRESASTMDPNIHTPGNPAYGIAQWEGGRLTFLQNTFAPSQGKPWNDFGVQLNYVWYELTNTHQTALAQIQAAGNEHDAAVAWMKYFEVPAVVVHGNNRYSTPQQVAAMNAEGDVRAGRGQPVLDALNNATNAVNQARAAAAAQAAAAAAAEKAKEEAAAAAAAEQQSAPAKIVASAKAELALWQNGTMKPTEYAAPSNYLKYSNGADTDWCAYFVAYILRENNIIDLPASEAAVVSHEKDALVASGKFSWHPAGNYTPKAGDIAIYGDYDHVNIVISASSPTNFDTIGGNQGNGRGDQPGYAAAYGGVSAYTYDGGNTGLAHRFSYVREYDGLSNIGGPVLGFVSYNG